jgi:hypothetical protein
MGNYSIFEPCSWCLKLWHCLASSKLAMKWSLYVHICQFLCDASIASNFNVPSSDVRWTWCVERVVLWWGTVPQPPTLCELQWWYSPPHWQELPNVSEWEDQPGTESWRAFALWVHKMILENKLRMLNRSVLYCLQGVEAGVQTIAIPICSSSSSQSTPPCVTVSTQTVVATQIEMFLPLAHLMQICVCVSQCAQSILLRQTVDLSMALITRN